MKLWIVVFIASLAVGCASTGGIPKDQYSKLETPEETFEFVKKSVASDDPEALYSCLADYIKDQVPLSDLKFAWGLAGKYFYIILTAKIENVESPAPDMIGKPFDTAKVTVRSGELKAEFLLLKESEQWRIANPQHYPLPDISKLKEQGRIPWRTERDYYQVMPNDWLKPTKIERDAGRKAKMADAKIPWSSQRNYYQEMPKDWLKPKRVKREAEPKFEDDRPLHRRDNFYSKRQFYSSGSH